MSSPGKDGFMPALNESGLKEKLRSNPLGIYLIYGEESYLKKTYIEKIISKTVDKSFEDFNLHVFDGKECTLSDVYEIAGAVPMRAESKCVSVKDFPLDTLDDNGFEQLEKVLSDNPDDCALIFSFAAYEPKGAKWNKAVKMFEKYGCSVKLEKKSTVDLIKMLESGAKKRGASFDKGATAYLVSCVGSDLNTLLNELEKVCAYAQNDLIKKSDIDAVCIKSLDAKVFDMIKDLTAGRFESAFRKLSVLFEQREDEFQILGALIAQYSDIYRAKAAVKSGGRAEMIANYYNYAGREFRLTNAARNASSLSFDDICECIDILAQADLMLKSSSVDKRLVLEQTVVRLARTGGR